MKLKKTLNTVAVVLFLGLLGEGHAQSSISHMTKNLLKMGYPLTKEDVLALDKVEMRFNSKNRITVLEKILKDRDFIHSREQVDYFVRTEAICDALRLLDELDIPVARTLIGELNLQQGWEARENTLLSFMAAKRGIRYHENVNYLLGILDQYGSDLERIYQEESYRTIIDMMNYLSYLADLYVYKGDRHILNTLITYSSRAYGFPAEHLSHMFVDMFLMRPKELAETLAARDAQTINTVTNAMIFGVRNNQVREKIMDVLNKDFSLAEGPGKPVIILLTNKIHSQAGPTGSNTLQKNTPLPAGSAE
jgi:hypothetical protein